MKENVHPIIIDVLAGRSDSDSCPTEYKGEFDTMKIQLSISLLASNRADSLERCLDSLRPLLMKVPSELIIVYTGTDERVREIAARYTDRILPFTWCNNFSAARNVGLWAARGEWFLFIDDDEWFEDTTEICDFFLSGEYRQYGSACYVQRNYLEWDGIHYSDFSAFRMSKMIPGIAFQNTVHEEITPRMNPCRYFKAFVHHYGYIVDKNVQGSDKTGRNLPLLQRNIQERPDFIKNYLQIVQEYASAKMWDKAEEYCRKARELCKKQKDPYYQLWLQVNLVAILYEKGDREQTEQEALSILEKEHPCELVCLEFYTTLIAIYAARNQSEKVLHYGKLFEKTLAYMDKNPHLWAQQNYGTITEERIKLPKRLYQIRINCAESALKMKDTKLAVFFMKLLPWDEEYWMQRYYPNFDFWEREYHASFQEIFKNFPADYPYVLLQRAREKNGEHQEAAALSLLEQCMETTESYYLQHQAIEDAVSHQINPSTLVKQLDLDTWKQSAEMLLNRISVLGKEQVEYAAKTLCQDQQNTVLYGLWLKMLLQEKELIRGYQSGQALFDSLGAYVGGILTFYEKQYQQEMFSVEQRNLLPKDCRFALFVSEALEKMNQQKFPEAIRLFRTALRYRAAMTGVIREVIRQMAAKAGQPGAGAGEEFQMLAGQMKGTLKNMVGNGQFAEALSVIMQLSQLLPEDLELLRMRQKVLQQLSE